MIMVVLVLMVVIMLVFMVVVVMVVVFMVMVVMVLVLMIMVVVVVLILAVIFRIENKFFRSALATELQVFKQPSVGQVQFMRIFPIVFCNLVQSLDNFRIVYFNGEFSAVVKTSGGKIDRTDNSPATVGEEHLAM